MADNTAMSKVVYLSSSPESRKSASSNPKPEMSQLKSKIEWADKEQLRHAIIELCEQIPEAAKLLSSLLPSPPRAARDVNHPSRTFTSKAPRRQLTTKAARKTASATVENVSGDDSEEESRIEN